MDVTTTHALEQRGTSDGGRSVPDLAGLVLTAQNGDLDAFAEIVSRFQDMAYLVAYAMLGDFQLAEDAAQEAFVDAYLSLPTLRQPAAFPGWFRRVVCKHGDRVVRGKHLATVPLAAAAELVTAELDPAAHLEAQELNRAVRTEVTALPDRQRIVVTLFYLADQSQREIADVLDVPVATVKKRLHDARKRLRERMVVTMRETLQARSPSRDDRFARKVQFLVAVCTGDVRRVQQLLQQDPSLLGATLAKQEWSRADVGPHRYPMAFEQTPLHLAANYGAHAVADVLLANDTDVNAAPAGETALHRAVLVGDRAMVELLLHHGADVNIPAGNGLTPLHRAVIRCQSEITQVLLSHGADVNALDRAGRTPLHWAALEGSAPLVEDLMRAGAVPHARDANGQMPSDLAPSATRSTLAGLSDRSASMPVPTVPVGDDVLGRVLDASGEPLDQRGSLARAPRARLIDQSAETSDSPAPTRPLETGIKVVDLFAPIVDGGTLLLLGRPGLGVMLLLNELVQRLARRGGRAVWVSWQERTYRPDDLMREMREFGAADWTALVLGRISDASGEREQALRTGWTIAEQFRQTGRDVLLIVDAKSPPEADVAVALATQHGPSRLRPDERSITRAVIRIASGDGGSQEPVASVAADTWLAFDQELGRQGFWPAVDPLASGSRLLDAEATSLEHRRVALQARHLLRRAGELGDRQALGSEEQALAGRARRLRRFLTQPFFAAEPWSGIPGAYVPLDATIRGVQRLLAGQYDAVPDERLAYIGAIEQTTDPA